ncbi:hypothetical protein JTB14_035053 [Gonioctena quinquepunctata]|nr:hypothetical protein JTB14_035053 [Gonioctena quinquepunctata]
MEIETYNFENDDDQVLEKKSDQQNEQEIEHEDIGIEEAEQEEDDSNKENSEQLLNLSSKRKREQSPVTVPKVKSTKKEAEDLSIRIPLE